MQPSPFAGLSLAWTWKPWMPAVDRAATVTSVPPPADVNSTVATATPLTSRSTADATWTEAFCSVAFVATASPVGSSVTHDPDSIAQHRINIGPQIDRR